MKSTLISGDDRILLQDPRALVAKHLENKCIGSRFYK